MNSEYAEDYYNKGLAYQRLKDNPQAISFYQQGLKRQFHPQVQQLMLDLLLKEGITAYKKKGCDLKKI